MKQCATECRVKKNDNSSSVNPAPKKQKTQQACAGVAMTEGASDMQACMETPIAAMTAQTHGRSPLHLFLALWRRGST